MPKKIKITFAIPEKLQFDLRHQIIEDGSSLRDKSRWICQAIESFLSMPNFVDFVLLGDEMQGFKKIETIVVNTELKSCLDHAILTVRKKYPTLEGVQSQIIRTSILQRLIRKA